MHIRSSPAPVFLIVASLLAVQGAHAQTRTSRAGEFVSWLNDPSRQWLATAELQRIPDEAIPLLLEPGRAVLGPHGSLTPALLALAKIGEPAVPAIAARVRAIQRKDFRYAGQSAEALIDVLGAIGLGAIPALVEFSDGDDFVGMRSLNAIVEMEPRASHYGQLLSPWTFWRPADDHLARLERAIVPLLPRIEQAMNRALQHKDLDSSSSSSVRPAAYLLARWGASSQRTRALQVLEELARSAKHFYNSVDVIRQLYPLKAPATASLIRLTAPRVTPGKDLTASYLLHMAVGLQQLGERDYGPLVDEAIRTGRPVDRMDAATFLGRTEDLANVPRLVALLDDRTPWSGRVVGDEALQALNRLTLQDLPADRAAWKAWLAAHAEAQHRTLLGEWLTGARNSIDTVPIWTANAWMAKIRWTRDPRVVPLVMDYLRRPDLAASATGPGRASGGGADGPQGKQAPAVVTLLLGLAQQGANEGVDALEACVRAADPEVRWFGAMALAAYRPRQAVEHLARELRSADAWRRSVVGELLLMLGDGRGIPARIDALELGSAMYGYGTMRAGDTTNELATGVSRGIRRSACLDLRIYTQQPLACDPNATGDALAAQVGAWRVWWNASGSGFALRSRQARLDLDLQYQIRPVTIGSHLAR